MSRDYYPVKSRNNYPKKQNQNRQPRPGLTAPMNRNRYKKGHQNSMTSARRRTVEKFSDKTVIIEEEVTIVEFNEDNFEIGFNKQNRRRK